MICPDPHLPNTGNASEEAAPESARTDAQHRADGDGAATPPLLIGGESQWTGYDPETGEKVIAIPNRKGGFLIINLPADDAHPYGAITDWLNIVFPMAPFADALESLFGLLFHVLGSKFGPAVERRGGIFCYERSFKLGETGALVAFGGNSGTGFLSLSGEACGLFQTADDWNRIVELGRDTLKGHITRWDGAVDDYLGVHSIEFAVQSYLDGHFISGGRQPKLNQIGNWLKPDGTGRSFVIGKRENGKRLQVYEKGMELGAAWHPWTRWEVTYGNTDRIVPWKVLEQPGGHTAGAYPKAMCWVQTEMCRIATLQKQTKLTFDGMADHVLRQYGPFLWLLREAEGSADKALDRVARPGTPKRLKHPAIENPKDFLK